MTNEEAKERLEKFKPFLDGDEWKECYQLAIDAIEKQITKKPKIEQYANLCPSCGHVVGIITDEPQKFCDECGQKIDWEDDDVEEKNDHP